MMECVECSDFAESFVADQSLFPFGSSFLVSAEIEGQSFAKQLDVRRTTLLQQLCFSLDLGITNGHSQYHANLSSHPYQC